MSRKIFDDLFYPINFKNLILYFQCFYIVGQNNVLNDFESYIKHAIIILLINQQIYFLESETPMKIIDGLEKENNIANINTKVEKMIYEIRGVQVMLSSDVATLYQVETRRINEVIKRNIKRFPNTFCFQLTETEFNNLRSQIAISSETTHGGVRYLPYVLTEQGIMMLSGLLKSDIAVKVNVQIIDAFVKLRRYVSNSLLSSETLLDHEKRILQLENTFNKMHEKQKINTIFFEGQIFDAYTLLLDLFETAKKEIIIIDNYASKELLKILKNIDKRILIISKNIDDLLIKKYNCEYSNIEFKNLDIFHDRFLIIDRKKLYSCGASFKDLGKKCFAINEMESQKIIDALLEKII